MYDKRLIEVVDQLHAEGYRQGTPEWDIVFRSRKVEVCQEMRKAPSCRACNYFMYCDLAKAHLRDVAELNHQAKLREKARKDDIFKEVLYEFENEEEEED